MRLQSTLFLLLFLCSLAVEASINDHLKALQNTSSASEKLKVYDKLLLDLTREQKQLMPRYFQKACSLATETKSTSDLANYHISYGMWHYFGGRMDSTLQHYLFALRKAEEINDLKTSSRALHELGVFYRRNKMPKESESALSKSVTLAKEINDSDGAARSLNSLGVFYEDVQEYEKAEAAYKESLQLYEALQSELGASYSYSNLGLLALKRQRYAESKIAFEKSLSLRKKLNDQNAIAISLVDIAEYYLAVKEYDSARAYANQSASLAQKIKYLDLLQYNYNVLAKSYEAQNNFQMALQYQQLHENLKDSIFNLQKAGQIAELQTVYETEKKEQLLKIQALELNRRNYFIAALIFLVLLGAIAGYMAWSKFALQQKNRLQESIIAQQDETAKAIVEAEENERKRIAGDLHDGIGQLFSAVRLNLSNLSDKVQWPNADTELLYDKTLSLVDESCTELRSISHNMMPNVLLKRGLTAAIRDFVEKIDAQQLKVFLQASGLQESLAPNVEAVIYRVIQESVNNVIKHAQANELHIQFDVEDKELRVTIEDNGKGFDTSDLLDFEGIGLKNIRTRIAFLKGSVEWDSAAGKGTLVSIFVPLT